MSRGHVLLRQDGRGREEGKQALNRAHRPLAMWPLTTTPPSFLPSRRPQSSVSMPPFYSHHSTLLVSASAQASLAYAISGQCVSLLPGELSSSLTRSLPHPVQPSPSPSSTVRELRPCTRLSRRCADRKLGSLCSRTVRLPGVGRVPPAPALPRAHPPPSKAGDTRPRPRRATVPPASHPPPQRDRPRDLCRHLCLARRGEEARHARVPRPLSARGLLSRTRRPRRP